MGADIGVAWTRDLGGGRLLVMELVAAGYRASLGGFRGIGATPYVALDDLLGNMRKYSASSEDLARALEPGGHLHEQMLQIEQIVDQIARGKA